MSSRIVDCRYKDAEKPPNKVSRSRRHSMSPRLLYAMQVKIVMRVKDEKKKVNEK